MKLSNGDIAEQLDKLRQFDLADKARVGRLERDELKRRLVIEFGRSKDGAEKESMARLMEDLGLFKEHK